MEVWTQSRTKDRALKSYLPSPSSTFHPQLPGLLSIPRANRARPLGQRALPWWPLCQQLGRDNSALLPHRCSGECPSHTEGRQGVHSPKVILPHVHRESKKEAELRELGPLQRAHS